jgi:hypothetical protein
MLRSCQTYSNISFIDLIRSDLISIYEFLSQSCSCSAATLSSPYAVLRLLVAPFFDSFSVRCCWELLWRNRLISMDDNINIVIWCNMVINMITQLFDPWHGHPLTNIESDAADAESDSPIPRFRSEPWASPSAILTSVRRNVQISNISPISDSQRPTKSMAAWQMQSWYMLLCFLWFCSGFCCAPYPSWHQEVEGTFVALASCHDATATYRNGRRSTPCSSDAVRTSSGTSCSFTT